MTGLGRDGRFSRRTVLAGRTGVSTGSARVVYHLGPTPLDKESCVLQVLIPGSTTSSRSYVGDGISRLPPHVDPGSCVIQVGGPRPSRVEGKSFPPPCPYPSGTIL